MAAEVAARYGVCDVLVNCAGVTRFVPHNDLVELDDALIDKILSTNVRGPFATVRAMRPLLEKSKKTGGAVVINISSIAGVTAMGSNVIYCASKAAVDNMTKSLARALAPQIRVMSVSPGVVDNDFVRSMDEAWLEEQVAALPLSGSRRRRSGCLHRGGSKILNIYNRLDHPRGRRAAAQLTDPSRFDIFIGQLLGLTPFTSF